MGRSRDCKSTGEEALKINGHPGGASTRQGIGTGLKPHEIAKSRTTKTGPAPGRVGSKVSARSRNG